MSPDELRQLFPNLTPITSPPGMSTINGVGTTVYGRRDYDPNTGTYVKTYCFCVLFVPIIAISAYRVADAPSGGWYFLGREPLSGLAKGWNLLLLLGLCAIGALIGIGAYLNTPERRAARLVEEAREFEEKGDLLLAVARYREASPLSAAAPTEGLRRLAQEKFFAVSLSAAPALAREILAAAGIVDKAWAGRVLAWVGKGKDEDPQSALALLGVVRGLANDEAACAKLDEQCLEAVLAKNPLDVGVAVRLSAIFEAREAWDRCEAVLLPVKDRLGDGEGARVLGHLLAQKGDLEGSFALLHPYVEKNLARYHQAEKAFEDSLKGAQARGLADLNANRAPRSWYDTYEKEDEVGKQKMVDEYLMEHLGRDPVIGSSRQALQQAGKIVPVALDLGIVRLGRAQSMEDPAKRKKELEEAEKVFLEVSGAAGESDTYRVFLGQVKYWLGKNAEGKALFDEYLASTSRSSEALLQIAHTLRNLGAATEARGLAEESWTQAAEPAAKHEAASLRALMETDEDDAILWLERSDPENPGVRARLAEVRGRKSLSAGDDQAAAKQFRAAADLYGQGPQTAATVNNRALAFASLYAATGEVSHFDEYVNLMLRAETLEPGNSILMTNTADALLKRAVIDSGRKEIDVVVLRPWGDLRFLSNLHNGGEEHAALAGRFREHPDLKGAIERFQKAMVVMPRNADSYQMLLSIHSFLEDEAAIDALLKRLEEADLDLAGDLAGSRALYDGTRDGLILPGLRSGLARKERVLAAARTKGGPTLAAACAEVVDARGALVVFGEPCDLEALVALAEEGYHARVSSSTRGSLINALTLRGVARVEAAVPAVAALRKAGRRALNASYLVAYALETGDEAVRAALAADPDLRLVAGLIVEDWKARPKWRSPWEWQFLRGLSPAAAEEARVSIGENRLSTLWLEATARLNPLGATTAFDRHWARLIAGDEEGARAVLDEAAERGIPIPGR